MMDAAIALFPFPVMMQTIVTARATSETKVHVFSLLSAEQAVAANVPCASGLVTVAGLSESDFIF
jgi:hypothetical protein